jgi:acyl carrier protein
VGIKTAVVALMSDALTEKVLFILASVKRIPRDRISLDSPLQDLGLDSLDTIVLLSELEDQFKINIPDDKARLIRSVRDVVEGVRSLSGSAPMNSAALAD